ncbi:MAG: hypothetical protein H6662_19980 [Ardenticatenaceae bacterium]|nr:hypothetical protein [Anaerolineales bacterium]MCB8923864.1 hypothetical protein [Ardenticatenaceae bacterium]MCB9003357.1 hypothetical protein [Ardenticatenaceae bacterium]
MGKSNGRYECFFGEFAGFRYTAMMIQLPTRITVVRRLTIIWAVYALVWMGWEGNLHRVVWMGAGTALLLAVKGLQWVGRKRPYPSHHLLAITTALGLLAGLGAIPLTLLFMVVKTGLHAHGPEFTLIEINWVIQQTFLWGLVGALLGLGMGLLLVARFLSTSHQ